MDAYRFDTLVASLVTSNRRGLVRFLAALPLLSPLAFLDEGAEAAKRGQRPGNHRQPVDAARKKKCAKAGQKTSKKRKRCCQGLVKNASGVCVAPSPPPVCPPVCPKCQTCTTATAGCVPVANGTACSDGSPCTRPDTCQGGVCVGGPSLPNGTPCNDRNACTQKSACQNGVCVGTDPVVCLPPANPDVCPGPGTCDPATGQCHFPNGAICGAQPNGGNVRCCNGACTVPTCLPPGTSITVPDCGTCTTMGEAQCCSKSIECSSDNQGNFASCSCIVGGGFCGSDADCQSETPACICGACEAAP
jgi:hypothetical protein